MRRQRVLLTWPGEAIPPAITSDQAHDFGTLGARDEGSPPPDDASGQSHGLGGEHLVRGVKRDLWGDIDLKLCHSRPQTILTEGLESFFTLPGVDVVVVVALPPRDV
ncbi:MAG: hypothetical protein M3144_02990 [Actinomycetota bacterium]|nr:hypothetical protein [Actinomycetota bacterium]